MDKSLKDKIGRVLQEESQKIRQNEKNQNEKIRKLNDILHLLQILENFDELEPVIAKHINQKGKEKKCKTARQLHSILLYEKICDITYHVKSVVYKDRFDLKISSIDLKILNFILKKE